MITNCHDEETCKVWPGEFSRRLPSWTQEVARRNIYPGESGIIHLPNQAITATFHTRFWLKCKIPPHWRQVLENLYNILGVAPTATTEEIKKAYRSLAMRHHPDRDTHPGSEIRFNAIKTAYELLSDQKKRAEYNQSLNNRIIIDPDNEARALWHALFERCGVAVPNDDHSSY